MATIQYVSRILDGIQRQIDLSSNTVWVGDVQLNNSSGYTLSGITSGHAGSSLIGDDNSYSNIDPSAATVKGALSAIDTILGGAGNAANKTLSNLTSPTSINEPLIPASNNTALGSTTSAWGPGYISQLNDASNNPSIYVYNRNLIDSSGVLSVDYTDRVLDDSSGNAILTWASAIQFNQLTASTVPYLDSSSNLVSSAVTPTELGYVSGVTSAIQTQLNGKLSLTGGTMSGAINMGSSQINNMADPSSAQDAATKHYVDNLSQGLSWKQVVRSATTTTLPSYTYANGVITATANGALTAQDGVTLVANDRLLVKDETGTNEPYNGIYVVTAVGDASDPYVLTRSSDTSTAAELEWATVQVSPDASTQGGFIYRESADITTIGTDNVTFANVTQGSTYSFTSGVQQSGNTVSANVDNSSIDVNGSSQLEIKDAGVTAAKLATITDGVTLDQSGAGSTLEVKAAGIGTTQLAASSVTAAKLGSVTDGVTLDQSGAGSTLEVKDAGISATQLATGAFDQSTITGGAGTAASVAYSPALKITATYNGSTTLSANTTYALRWGIPANSETAGDLYLADWSTSSYDEFWATGLYKSSTSTSTGTSVTITVKGAYSLGSSDTNFGTNDQGKPVWLGASGAIVANSTFSPSSGDANEKLGIATSATTIFVNPEMLGVS